MRHLNLKEASKWTVSFDLSEVKPAQSKREASVFRSSGGQTFVGCVLQRIRPAHLLFLKWSVRSADQQEVRMSLQHPRVNPPFDPADKIQPSPVECVFDPSSAVLEFGVEWLTDSRVSQSLSDSLRVSDLGFVMFSRLAASAPFKHDCQDRCLFITVFPKL